MVAVKIRVLFSLQFSIFWKSPDFFPIGFLNLEWTAYRDPSDEINSFDEPMDSMASCKFHQRRG